VWRSLSECLEFARHVLSRSLRTHNTPLRSVRRPEVLSAATSVEASLQHNELGLREGLGLGGAIFPSASI
jgi:hypothetical protein